MFIVLLTFGIVQAPIFAQQSQQNSSVLSYQECQNKIGNEMQKTVDSINKTKAILLAINSNEFQSKTNGYRYVYSDIFTNMTEDQNVCGDVKLTSIVIEFSILNNSSNFVKFIQVGEDPQISQVTLVEDVFVSNCDNSCPPPSPPAGNIQKSLTSPLRQIASGVSPKDVKCRQDLTLIFRAEDNFPACVKPSSIERLLKQGWVNAYDNNGKYLPIILPNMIKVQNTNFTINYDITGNNKLIDANMDSQSKSLILSLQSTNNGTLSVSIPRALLDSNLYPDTHFIVLVDKKEVNFTETVSLTARTLIIPFEYGAETMEIIAPQRI